MLTIYNTVTCMLLYNESLTICHTFVCLTLGKNLPSDLSKKADVCNSISKKNDGRKKFA